MKRKVFAVFSTLALVFGLLIVGCDTRGSENDCTVTFNLDGGNINGNTSSVLITVKNGATIDNLPQPQKANNTFGGWFTATNGAGNQFTTTTIVTSNLTVFAKWTSNSGNGNNENPFKGTWTGNITTPGGSAVLTIIISDTTFEGQMTMGSTNTNIKQRGNYTHTSTSFTGTITAVDFIQGGESLTDGWVSSGEFFDAYSSGGYNLTLSNGKLVFNSGQLTGELTKDSGSNGNVAAMVGDWLW